MFSFQNNKVFDLFNTDEAKEHGIFCFEFNENDIVRSELCKYITQQFKVLNFQENNKDVWKPSDGK